MAICDCVVVGICLSLVKQGESVLKEQREVGIVASIVGRLFPSLVLSGLKIETP